MTQAGTAERGGKAPGAVGRAVVGHAPLDRDARALEPGERAFEEGGGVGLALGGQHFGIGQARCVIDADMEEVPADTLRAAELAVAGDAVAGGGEASELLDVEVDHIARRRMLVADHRWPGIEQLELAEPQPPERQSDRRARHAQRGGDRRTRHPFPPQPLDFVHPLGSDPVRTVPRCRAAVAQPFAAAMPIQPAISGPRRHASGLCRPRYRPPVLDPINHYRSTTRRLPGILVHVHSRISGARVGASQLQSLSTASNEQPS
ncbi:hypothetical protein [uncultured Sphingomonas sp.]|uniref:hypothetical protein n=1 Tax=uncultured Sphingomonas sp. TaxID=158754 RepID=UPI0030FB9938